MDKELNVVKGCCKPLETDLEQLKAMVNEDVLTIGERVVCILTGEGPTTYEWHLGMGGLEGLTVSIPHFSKSSYDPIHLHIHGKLLC